MIDEQQHREDLLQIKRRRLMHLEGQAAQFGIDCPAHIALEISDLQAEISALAAQLQRSAPATPAFQSNLPPYPQFFVERSSEVSQLMAKLAAPNRVSPIVVEGMFGIGKSALVNYVAHRCFEEKLFDGYIWWSAKYDAQSSLGDLIDLIGRLLGQPTASGQPLYASSELYDLLRRRSYLLIVTKVTQSDHAEIIEFLANVPPPTCVIITTTSPLPVGSHIPALKPYSPAAALAFLRARAQQLDCVPILSSPDKALAPLCEASGGLPAALSLAVGLAKKGEPLNDIIAALASGAGAIGTLCARVYQRLAPQPREALNLICASHATIAASTLMHLLRLDRATFKNEAIRPLREMGLLLEDYAATLEQMRFAPANHLVRSTYADMLRRQPGAYQKLRKKIADYYARECRKQGHENWLGYDWLDQNLSEITGTLEWYEHNKQPKEVIRLFKSIYYFLGVRGYWHHRLEYGAMAIRAARATNDRQSLAEVLVRVVGWTQLQIGRIDEAEATIRQGLAIFSELGDGPGQASAYRYLGTIQRRRGDVAQAQQLYEQALAHASAAHNGALIAGTQISLGTLELKLGRLDEAEQRFAEARAAVESSGHLSKVAEVLSRIADIKLLRGQLDAAQQLYLQSQVYAEQIGRQKTAAYNMLGLARIELLRGNKEESRAKAVEARRLFGNLGIANEAAEITGLRQLLE